jgi:hypothetical protein
MYDFFRNQFCLCGRGPVKALISMGFVAVVQFVAISVGI